jgi:methyl-accepting chemotaxis protein
MIKDARVRCDIHTNSVSASRPRAWGLAWKTGRILYSYEGKAFRIGLVRSEEKIDGSSERKGFFVKKDLQIRFILKIVVSVVLTAVITTAVLAAVYYYKSGSGYFFFMSNNLHDALQRQSILQTILPSLVIAELVSILLGVAIGLFSSRKLAVPIYNIEQWLASIIQGKFGAKIRFKEKEEFIKISTQCNLLSDSLVNVFSHLYDELSKAEESVSDKSSKEKIARIRKMLPDLNAPGE